MVNIIGAGRGFLFIHPLLFQFEIMQLWEADQDETNMLKETVQGG